MTDFYDKFPSKTKKQLHFIRGYIDEPFYYVIVKAVDNYYKRILREIKENDEELKKAIEDVNND